MELPKSDNSKNRQLRKMDHIFEEWNALFMYMYMYYGHTPRY